MRPTVALLSRIVAPAVLLGLLSCLSSAQASGVTDKLREGCQLLVGGRWDQASRAFREAGRQDTGCLEALLGEGTSYLLAGFQEAGLDCFERALVLDKDDPTARVGRATASVLGRQYESAVDDYGHALEFASPHRAAILASEAQVACLTGLYEVAENEAQQALVEQPGNELARQVLAAALIARNRPTEALQALTPPPDPGSAFGQGIVATSPLFVSSSKYYVDANLDDNIRLA